MLPSFLNVIRRGRSLITCLALLAACAAPSAAPPVTSEPILPSTPTEVAQASTSTPVPTAEGSPTPDGPTLLTVWWPEPLAPVGDAAASRLLEDQLDQFHASQSAAQVEFRLKKAEDVGGIMETLRAASAVAPGALPDLTLMRRSDLLTAAQTGLIQPLTDMVTSSALLDVFPAAAEMGRVGGQLYGLPYALDVEHIAYRPVALAGSFSTFESVILDGQPYIFPAAGTRGLSHVFLVQYLSAGGRAADFALGRPNEDAVRAVLAFYQDTVSRGIVDPSVLNYASPSDYQAGVIDGRINAAVVTASQYLSLRADGIDVRFAPIPVESGESRTVLDGWMWVLASKAPDHQEQAIRFVIWMAAASRQATYAEVVHLLPASQSALRIWGEDAAYREFVTGLLRNAVLPLSDNASSAMAGAMQTALVAVLSGQRTADEATGDVMEQVESS